ncbi:MAG: hypothetical protein MUD01_07735 [Chloroflexaceae bacterium]|jgi:uncharacterized protein YbaR (Trm112 family)|nr:hypothetical protein [Chloroflexaceae bacterium]
MAIDVVSCPVCRQKLAIQIYMRVGSRMVCANKECGTSLRLVSRRPLQVERVAEAETFNPDDRPESYG